MTGLAQLTTAKITHVLETISLTCNPLYHTGKAERHFDRDVLIKHHKFIISPFGYGCWAVTYKRKHDDMSLKPQLCMYAQCPPDRLSQSSHNH